MAQTLNLKIRSLDHQIPITRSAVRWQNTERLKENGMIMTAPVRWRTSANKVWQTCCIFIAFYVWKKYNYQETEFIFMSVFIRRSINRLRWVYGYYFRENLFVSVVSICMFNLSICASVGIYACALNANTSRIWGRINWREPGGGEDLMYPDNTKPIDFRSNYPISS